MSKLNRDQHKKSSLPSQAEVVNKDKQKEEVKEVQGRHKNAGQKDHKGARS